MGLLDALRRLFSLTDLDKIKRAITGLSDGEWNNLLEWMENQLHDVETDFDPDPLKVRHYLIGDEETGWY